MTCIIGAGELGAKLETREIIKDIINHLLKFWIDILTNVVMNTWVLPLTLATGCVIGHLRHPLWREYGRLIMLAYSSIYGFCILFLVGNLTVILCDFLQMGNGNIRIYITMILLLIISSIVSTVNVHRERERREKLEELKRKYVS